MAIFQPPQVSTWYINRTGKLLKVKMVLHDRQGPVRVLVEYIDGVHQITSIDDWYCLDLNVHCRYDTTSPSASKLRPHADGTGDQ